jgi:nicotinamidase-related amidase
MPLAPRPGAEVLAAGKALAARFRAASAPVFPVRVGWSADFADGLTQPVDRPMARPAGGLPAGWSDLAEGVAAPGDVVITKRQWGAFYGTELDLQLRRRGIDTIVLGGIATHIGVESTARAAYEHGYQQIFVEDAMSDLHADTHESTFRYVFPRIGRIRSTAQVIAALE